MSVHLVHVCAAELKEAAEACCLATVVEHEASSRRCSCRHVGFKLITANVLCSALYRKQFLLFCPPLDVNDPGLKNKHLSVSVISMWKTETGHTLIIKDTFRFSVTKDLLPTQQWDKCSQCRFLTRIKLHFCGVKSVDSTCSSRWVLGVLSSVSWSL